MNATIWGNYTVYIKNKIPILDVSDGWMCASIFVCFWF